MLSQLQASYRRVEASLVRLTDSIAAYTPSTTAAEELIAADERVKDDLNLLVQHQRNHLRLQELRQTAESLNETIRTTLRLLMDTRQEIQAIPPIETGEAQKGIDAHGLLRNAKFISRTTVPPTFRQRATESPTPALKPADTNITNGIATPPSATAEPARDDGTTENVGLKAVDPKIKAWLNPEQEIYFEPWPSVAAIEASALKEIQKMAEAGQDPASVLTAEERAEEGKRRQEEEAREKREQEEAERRNRELFDVRRRNTVADQGAFNPDDL